MQLSICGRSEEKAAKVTEAFLVMPSDTWRTDFNQNLAHFKISQTCQSWKVSYRSVKGFTFHEVLKIAFPKGRRSCPLSLHCTTGHFAIVSSLHARVEPLNRFPCLMTQARG
jgi:hypothetical protein